MTNLVTRGLGGTDVNLATFGIGATAEVVSVSGTGGGGRGGRFIQYYPEPLRKKKKTITAKDETELKRLLIRAIEKEQADARATLERRIQEYDDTLIIFQELRDIIASVELYFQRKEQIDVITTAKLHEYVTELYEEEEKLMLLLLA